jgi:multidrug efflux pump subunit AcrA (membrane-fusion protein)
MLISLPLPLLVVALSCALLVGAGGALLARRRRGSRQGAAALASLDQVAAAVNSLEADLAAQRQETAIARAQRDDEARKAREYFERIDGVVKEATECRRLLVRTGAEHGNAQAMMLTEIDSLARQYALLAEQYRDATGKAPPRPEPALNRTIQLVASEFREAHVVPYQAPQDGKAASGGTTPGLDRVAAKA